ncbi:MAG: putative toxin-antitoxin system toxin component, PIN family [Verrucomicrobiota bacterium]|jgi:putative PIN family toxin of toxin-antitoxin system
MIPTVIDTGVLVSGIYWRHEPHLCVRAWLRGLIVPVVSDSIYSEYDRVLHEVKNEQGFQTNLEPWLAAIRKSALWITPVSLAERVCRDDNDDKFIGAALAAGAKTVIARDRDLTLLEKPFGIAILTPRQLLAALPRTARRKLG